MAHKHFGDLLDKIQAKSTCKDLTVLDRGLELILVRTTSKLWFLYEEGVWEEITDTTAKRLCDHYFFSNRYSEMT